MSEPFLASVREAAEILKVDEETVRRLVREGKLTSRQVDGELRIPRQEVVALGPYKPEGKG